MSLCRLSSDVIYICANEAQDPDLVNFFTKWSASISASRRRVSIYFSSGQSFEYKKDKNGRTRVMDTSWPKEGINRSLIHRVMRENLESFADSVINYMRRLPKEHVKSSTRIFKPHTSRSPYARNYSSR